MPNPAAIDVLIVGAGPTGLLLANLLKRQNISVRLIDRAEKPVTESRALGIQAKTLEIFRSLGLERKFLDAGVKTKGVELYLRGEKRFSIDVSDMARPDTPYPFLFMLPQSKTEQILIKDLVRQGVSVERSTTLTALEERPGGLRAVIETTAGSEKIDARYVVGCDGAHSAVRKFMEIPFEGDRYDNEFIMADAHIEWPLDEDKLRVFLDPGRIGVYFPRQRSGFSRVLTVRRSPNTRVPLKTETTTAMPATLEEVETNFGAAAHLDVKLKDPDWVTKYYVHHRSARKMRKGRVFLAGDAAHIHSPVGAQGMNTGLQDAANLAWKLATVLNGTVREEIRETLLDTYHSERWPIGQKLIRFTDRLFSFAETANPLVLGLRDFFLPIVTKALMRYPTGKRYLFRFISQLAIHYHPSAAVYERLSPTASATFRRTLPTGSRAPNARINEKLEVFDLIKGYKFHLLVLSRKRLSQPEIDKIKKVWTQSKRYPKVPLDQHWITLGNASAPSTIKAATKEIFERFGVTDSGIFLIRPDGYIGYRADTLEQAFKRLRVETNLAKNKATATATLQS